MREKKPKEEGEETKEKTENFHLICCWR